MYGCDHRLIAQSSLSLHQFTKVHNMNILSYSVLASFSIFITKLQWRFHYIRNAAYPALMMTRIRY